MRDPAPDAMGRGELNLRRVRPGKHDAERLIYTLGDFFGAQFQRDGELTNYPR